MSSTKDDFSVEKLEEFFPVRFSKLTPEGTLAASFDKIHFKEGEQNMMNEIGQYQIIISPQNDLKSPDRQIWTIHTLDELKQHATSFLNEGWTFTEPPEEKLTDEDGNPLTGRQKKKLKRYIERKGRAMERKERRDRNKR